MKEAKTKSVNMTFPALYSYVINTNYRSLGGVMGVLISLVAIVLLIINWSKFTPTYRVLLLLVGLLFTVINPLMLAFKSFRQLKLSPSYKKPLEYVFADDGIHISQGELHETLKWDMICRIMMTNQMLAIYTSRLHAFVIPLSELGEDKGKILASVVQFTAAYKPRVSKNLKRFQSGKGI
ncbi:MAG: YcxB family protein [Wujia sp.]